MIQTTPTRSQTPVQHVVIVSFDGGKPSVMRSCKMPNMERVVREGAGTWAARTVFPSITLLSHASMVTGVVPREHGLLWNDWHPEKGYLKAPTIFKTAKAADKKLTSGIFAGKEKFAHLMEKGVLDAMTVTGGGAVVVADSAARFITRVKPNLTLVHFADPDSAGHSKGWGSPEQKAAFEHCDRALGILLDALKKAGIADRSVVITSADHGGHAKTHGSAWEDDMNIPWWTAGATVRRGSVLKGPVRTIDTAATALWLLGVPVPKSMEGQPVREAFSGID
ncbi:MAG: alkaline phosphatase family protein [Armatimonadaceae bacterium]